MLQLTFKIKKMKSFKMLIIAALTILSASVFAQDTTRQKIKKEET